MRCPTYGYQMSKFDRASSWALAVAVMLGLGLITYAVVSGSPWAALLGLFGLFVAGKSAIILARRSGATDQPQ